MEAKFPEIHVQLSGEDGNAGAIIGRTVDALRRGGADKADIAEFRQEVYSGDYDNVLQTIMRWVDVS